MELSKPEFENLRHYIHKLCGLSISEAKMYLVRQRLQPLAEQMGCRSFAEFYLRLKDNPSAELLSDVVISMTTNETSFFRDEHPFDTFRHTILPELAQNFKKKKESPMGLPYSRIHIWSAASSTGQEACSLAMLIDEFLLANRLLNMELENFHILGTDISDGCLAKAKRAIYTELEVTRGLNEKRLNRYFTQVGPEWLFCDKLRNMTEFLKVNLMDPFTSLGRFDVIFCRNVLIYFEDEAKKRILTQFKNMLTPGGYLILGASENLYALCDCMEAVKLGNTTCYRKKTHIHQASC